MSRPNVIDCEGLSFNKTTHQLSFQGLDEEDLEEFQPLAAKDDKAQEELVAPKREALPKKTSSKTNSSIKATEQQQQRQQPLMRTRGSSLAEKESLSKTKETVEKPVAKKYGGYKVRILPWHFSLNIGAE